MLESFKQNDIERKKKLLQKIVFERSFTLGEAGATSRMGGGSSSTKVELGWEVVV